MRGVNISPNPATSGNKRLSLRRVRRGDPALGSQSQKFYVASEPGDLDEGQGGSGSQPVWDQRVSDDTRKQRPRTLQITSDDECKLAGRNSLAGRPALTVNALQDLIGPFMPTGRATCAPPGSQ